MSELTEAHIIKLLKERGENPSLPFFVFSEKGLLVLANERGRKVLMLSEKELPLSKENLLKTWTFYNEELGAPAILSRALSGISAHQKLLAQLGLKTYRIWTQEDLFPGHIVVFCELLRRGDLMQDKESRQHLFRVLAHEIRTSSLILGSYVDMVKADNPQLAARMEEGVKRLERAVELLQELKAELELK
jgi:hypothetical protein